MITLHAGAREPKRVKPTILGISDPSIPIESKFLDLVVPRSVIASLRGRYPMKAIGMETINNVESLANPASTRTDLASIGRADSQSAKISGERLRGLMFSLIRMLNRSLGYSGM
jgi:hypothetical protein